VVFCCCSQVMFLQLQLRAFFLAGNHNHEAWSSLTVWPQENRNNNRNLAMTYLPPPQRFHELLENITKKYENHQFYRTAFSDASQIIYNETDFFQPIRICEATCCAETVAISLDQDDRHIKNTLDGTDMADVFLQMYPSSSWICFFGNILHPDFLPCLQPGTIIHIDNHKRLLGYFYTKLRPNITVPYVLITSNSDMESPSKLYQGHLAQDNLMLKWFGTNPSTKGLTSDQKNKFHGMSLGLAKYQDQSRFLTEYLNLSNYSNPFRNKERWTRSLLMNMPPKTLDGDSDSLHKDVDEVFFKTVIIKFGLNRFSPRLRFKMWYNLCHDINSTHYDNVTCQNQSIHPRELYAAASTYMFGFSPPGAGPDCFRTYEFLLMGVIPIVPDLNWGGLFDDLPVLVLENFGKHRTRLEYLEIMRDYIASPKFQDQDFEKGWETLFLRYWRRRVLEAAGRTVTVDPATGKEYYLGWKYSSTANSSPTGLNVPQTDQ
jgi:hypothetical protein